MAKTRYEVLCDDLNARRVDQRKRQKLASDIARNFCDALASFLGVAHPRLDDPLVSLWGLAFDDDQVIIVHKGEEHTTIDNVLPDEQHDWVFAIHVQLNAEDFVARCSIRLKEPTIELRVADRPDPYPITPDDQATYEPALQALYDHLRKWLQWRPSSGKPMPRMGFDLRNP